MQKIFTLFLCHLFVLQSFAQVTDPGFDAGYAQKLNAALSEQGASGAFYGLSAAVFAPGQGQWIGTFGNSNTGQPITPDMRFCIASNSKSFTAALCLRLQEEGLLNLDDPIGKYLPGFKNLDPKITIRQCLAHQTGLADIYNDSSNETYDEFLNKPDSIWSPADVLNTLPAPFFAAGESYYYSNTNYIVAGMCCTAAAGKALGPLLKERVFQPLGLNKTVYASDGTTNFFNEPWAVLQTASGVGLEANHANGFNSFIQNAGGIWATAQDQIKWYRALFTGGYLAPASLAAMRAVEPWSSYSLGLRQQNQSGATLRYHAGAWGYRSILFYDEITGITVSVLSNLQGKSVTAVGERLLAVALSQRPKKANDVRLERIVSPVAHTFQPDSVRILVLNNGTQAITSLQVQAKLDAQVLFNGNLPISSLGAGLSRSIALPLSISGTSVGQHIMYVELRLNGTAPAGYVEDDAQSRLFVVAPSLANLPASLPVEHFDNAKGELPKGWISHQPNNVQDWRTSPFAGSGGALCRNQYNDGNAGAVYWLDLPPVRAGEAGTASTFSFDYAYAQYTGAITKDTLELLVSNNSNRQYISVWKKGGGDLLTADPTTASFLPADGSDQWRTVSLPMNTFISSNEATVFRFRVRNDYGNNIWLDNVGFQTITSAKAPIVAAFDLSPNPLQSSAIITFESPVQHARVRITDALGRTLREWNDVQGNQMLITREGLSAGLFALQVEADGKNLGKRMILVVD